MQTVTNTSQLTRLYHDKCTALARSIMVKSSTTANTMQQEVENLYYLRGKVPPPIGFDFHEWRYFKHLAGEYHEMDTLMQVRSLDTLQTIDFTRETLAQHTATLKHYREQGEYYDQLVEQYPDQHLLIDGICNPVDKDKAIEAPEYSILRYREDLVEHNEHNLIYTLNTWVERTMQRYHSLIYDLMDPLYEAVKLGILAIHLPGMIIAIREQHVGTIQAHSYHVWGYLGSYFGLDRYQPYLTHEQVMWLYRNTRYLDIHAGKKGNFDQLIYWLLTKRNIPIYKYKIGTDTEHLNEGKGKYNNIYPEDVHFGLRPNIEREQLNLLMYDYQTEEKNYTFRKVIGKEGHLAERNGDFLEYGTNAATDKFKTSTIGERDTKLLESTLLTFENQEVYPIRYTGLYYWIYMAWTNRYPYIGTITNPTNGEVFNLTSQEGFILFYYLTLKVSNLWNIPVENFTIRPVLIMDILYENLPWEEIERDYTVRDAGIGDGIDRLRADYPEYRTLYSTKEFVKFVDTMNAYREEGRGMYGQYPDLYQYGEMRHFVERQYFHTKVQLTPTPETFKEYFQVRHWHFDKLSRKQMEEMVVQLFGTFTGEADRPRNNAGEIQRAMIEILKRLSSYTVQFVSQTKGDDTKILDMPFIRYGHIKFHEYGKSLLFKKWHIKWFKVGEVRHGRVNISVLHNEKTMQLKGHATNETQFIPDMQFHRKGNTIHHHFVPMPGAKWERVIDIDMSRKVPSPYYVYHDGLYPNHPAGDRPVRVCQGEPGEVYDETIPLEINPGKVSQTLVLP